MLILQGLCGCGGWLHGGTWVRHAPMPLLLFKAPLESNFSQFSANALQNFVRTLTLLRSEVTGDDDAGRVYT
ncbi:hypothetical protein D3C77_798730 [compost metagenome]